MTSDIDQQTQSGQTVSRPAHNQETEGSTPSSATKPTKKNPLGYDWDAIRRDYRTGQFTDLELSQKHTVSREAICRRRKREPHLWPQDLTKAVREATNAALLQEAVTEAITRNITEGHEKVTNTILVAAEVNKNIITHHRSAITEASGVAKLLLEELKFSTVNRDELNGAVDMLEKLANAQADDGSIAEADKISPAHIKVLAKSMWELTAMPTRVQSMQRLADAMTKLQGLERKAYNLDETGAADENPVSNLLQFVRGGTAGVTIKADDRSA
jgi:hypothetical protein